MKELKSRGYIPAGAKVDGFVLGDKIQNGEAGTRKEDNDSVKIVPMLYETLLARAEKRMLSLNEKVRDAPFVTEQQDQLKRFLEPISVRQLDLTKAA